MRFCFTVIHTAGKNLYVADALSRAPVREADANEVEKEENLHIFVDSLMQGLSPTKKRLEEIKRPQDRDDVIKLVNDFCKTAWPESPYDNERVKKMWDANASILKKSGQSAISL
ncbi:Pol polyprotein [Elysia marginata]|uniref:Pol polyprotein n=1 Tax=Elysia marginata TaxID=1093978 RepID=A0AAV4F030_9GAST|nr:Pol polyprotein [Elysia marginata]